MKWINHKITTFSVVYLFTQDFASSVVASAGSVIPDAIEGYGYDNKRKKRHRKISHWLLGYFVIAFLLWLLIKNKTGMNALKIGFYQFVSAFTVFNSETLIFVCIYGCFYLCVGAFLHILEDSLSGPIPVIHPSKKVFTLNLIKVGSFGEYLLSFGILMFSLFFNKKL